MKQKQSDLWIYILLEAALLIFIESLKTFHISIDNVLISLSIPIIPFTFLITNLIIKKYNYKKGLLGVLISLSSTILFILMMSFALNKQIDMKEYIGEAIAYIISQLVNIFIYKYIQNNTKKSYPLTFLSYIFSLIFFYMTYTLSYLNSNIIDGYWQRYFISIIIQIVICIPITIIDKKIIKEKKEEK